MEYISQLRQIFFYIFTSAKQEAHGPHFSPEKTVQITYDYIIYNVD